MKKAYEIPSVEMTQVAMTSIVMAGSTGVTVNSGETIPGGGGGD
jgi:hypothetical protein